MAKPTIVDIAKLAGVSTATVSRALREPHMLAPDTLKRVQDVMAQQHYIYNAMAGDFSRRKSSVLGLFMPTAESAKISGTAIALQEVVGSHGFPIIISNTLFDEQLEREQIIKCRERSLSGMFFVGCMLENEPMIFNLAKDELPAFFLWDTLDDTSYNYVGFDNFDACYRMTRYLIDLGHKDIAFVGAMAQHVRRVYKRQSGYRQAMRDAGLNIHQGYIQDALPGLEFGKAEMKTFLSMPNPPTAIFFASDMLAIGALSACREAGIRVPEDISIAGFDNIEFAEHVYPGLTTVNVPAAEMGRIAGQCMIDILRHKKRGPFQYKLPVEIMARGTCAPPKGNCRV